MGNKGLELLGLLVLLLTVFTTLSLLGHSPQDPPQGTQLPYRNITGKVGAYLSYYLLTFLGYVSWVFVGLMGMFSVQFLRHHTSLVRWQSMLGWGLVFLGLTGLVSLWSSFSGGGEFSGGGVLGVYLISRLEPLFGRVGTGLLLTFALLIGLTVRSANTIHESTRDALVLSRRVYRWAARLVREGVALAGDVYAGIQSRWPESTSGTVRTSTPPWASGEEAGASGKDSNTSTAPDPKSSSGSSGSEPAESPRTEPEASSPDGSQQETAPDSNASESTGSPDAGTSQHDAVESPEDDEVSSEPVEVTTERPEVREVDPSAYDLPPLDLLEGGNLRQAVPDESDLQTISEKLQQTFQEFDIHAEVVAVNPGPVLTMYEVEPGPGVSVNKIKSRRDDIKLNLAVKSVRIVSPIPGKSAMGIEVPNPNRAIVKLRDVLSCDDFQGNDDPLPIALGLDVLGNPMVIDLARLPHLLIAGATGSGKSVCINTLICSLMYKLKPHELKFVLIDPKRVELTFYEGIPHLMTPVIDDPNDANKALKWAVREMENRYERLSEAGYRNIAGYNEDADPDQRMPYLVVIVDELADLMLTNPKECEQSITRLAQMARAVGIHMVLATQRPSTDVITGLIKANLPARVSFRVSSGTDSRVIIDQNGAETLLGDGDFLYLSSDAPNPRRGQGSFLRGNETKDLIRYIKEQLRPSYIDEDDIYGSDSPDGYLDDFEDEYYEEAKELVIQSGKASSSMIQRRFQVGYNRAARMVDAMEEEGIVGPHRGSKARKVLVDPDEFFDEEEGEDGAE